MLMALGVCACINAQTTEKYELQRDMPVYLDSIKSELTYPLAWGNSEISDFDLWRTTARDKVIELMLAPPPRANGYAMEIIGEEKRDGYTARKVRFNLTKYARVEAYILVRRDKIKDIPAPNGSRDAFNRAEIMS